MSETHAAFARPVQNRWNGQSRATSGLQLNGFGGDSEYIRFHGGNVGNAHGNR
jgi:hypothetical protein